MIKLKAILFFTICILSSCFQQSGKLNDKYKDLPEIVYCDLPKFQDREVILNSKYVGVMEYWSLESLTPCDQNLMIDFDTRDYYSRMPEKFKKKLNLGTGFYFVIKAVGKYESNNSKGYGHLGHNKSRFLVTELLEVKAIKY